MIRPSPSEHLVGFHAYKMKFCVSQMWVRGFVSSGFAAKTEKLEKHSPPPPPPSQTTLAM